LGKIEVLKTVPIFNDLSESDLKSVVNKMVSQSYKKGHVILEEDSTGDHCYFLTRGRVKITRVSSDEREVILALLGPGDFFGEMSLLSGEARSANVVTLEKTKALTLNTVDFLGTLELHPKVAINLLRELAIRLQKSDEQIASLSLSDAERRIAISILRIAEEQGTIQHGNVTIDPLPSQQDIANMAGTTRETVSRIYKLLVEDGHVQRISKKLIIVDFKRFLKDFSLN
jgi:CRP-like cAMP-binding protein